MAYDPAAFRAQDVDAVYPGYLQRTCWYGTKSKSYERHHILGRGPKKHDPDRELYSSVFNMAWLGAELHDGPLINDPRTKSILLERAFWKVMEAVREGRYTLNERDDGFLLLAKAWEEKAMKGYGTKA